MTTDVSGSSRSHGKVLVTACFAVLIALFALSMVSMKASAADENQIIVYGYVKDAGGTGIVGADVLIEMKHPDTTITSHSTTTTTNGYYTWTFEPNEWEPDDKIVVTATYNSEQVISPEYTATTDYIIEIDLQFTAGIPEFGTLVGFFAASGLVASVALIVLGVRRRDK